GRAVRIADDRGRRGHRNLGGDLLADGKERHGETGKGRIGWTKRRWRGGGPGRFTPNTSNQNRPVGKQQGCESAAGIAEVRFVPRSYVKADIAGAPLCANRRRGRHAGPRPQSLTQAELPDECLGYCGAMLAIRTTLPHFSDSAAMKAANSWAL